ncbi:MULTISPECIES: cytochrome c [Synechococcus]|uniref:c-type cytochrome n=1 Tax=Synechococcus TaxID=1129 RepID=UPI0009C6E66E|nr:MULTISPECIES: cytochrome c [Synechococcus]OON12816.1 MAG: cytochrome c-553-like protein [Synechococcus lacustris str. Tous]
MTQTEITTADNRRGLITALVGLALVAALLLSVFLYGQSRQDPYTRSSLDLQGDQERGSKLFLINCAGCHGIAGQGLVGPNLHGVSRRKGDSALIQQVVSGRTPPMPKFQPDPQAMADLLAHLHTLQ